MYDAATSDTLSRLNNVLANKISIRKKDAEFYNFAGHVHGELTVVDIYPECEGVPQSNRITIWHSGEVAAPDAISHEVRHLRRFFIDGAYKLKCVDGAPEYADRMLSDLDNDLEHLIIVPDDIRDSGAMVEYWRSDCMKAVASAVASHAHAHLFRHWVFANVVFPGDRGLLDYCKVQLGAQKHLADEYLKEILATGLDKVAMAMVAARWFGVATFVRLFRYGITEGGSIVVVE